MFSTKTQRSNALIISNIPTTCSDIDLKELLYSLSKNGFVGISADDKQNVIAYFQTVKEAYLVQKALELQIIDGVLLSIQFYIPDPSKPDNSIVPGVIHSTSIDSEYVVDKESLNKRLFDLYSQY